jgi:nucleotide-binding universal stress UspA family protein
MKPVVCCVDSSAYAPGVVAVARELATKLGLGLVVLNVAPSTAQPGVGKAAAGRARLRAAELEDANALLEKLARQEGLGDDVELRAEIGSTADRIVGVCAELGAELVVLGSRGHGDIASAVLGSVSNAVATRAPCPVVVVNRSAIEARQQ